MHSRVKGSKSECVTHKHLGATAKRKLCTQLDRGQHIKRNVSRTKKRHSPPAMAPIGVLFLAGAAAGAAA